jgi:hypothetical protein
LAITPCVSNNFKKIGDSNDDWQPLFNGKNPDGWIVKFHHHDAGDNYANNFRLKFGCDFEKRMDYDTKNKELCQ